MGKKKALKKNRDDAGKGEERKRKLPLPFQRGLKRGRDPGEKGNAE